MIKKTLYFGNPCYLFSQDEQMKIKRQNAEKGIEETNSQPIEDIGVVVIDHYGVTISQALLYKLNENNAAIIICNDKHMPTSMLMNLDGNYVQSERFKAQIIAKKPLLKNLWQQTVSYKIYNQAMLLNKNNIESRNMIAWVNDVKSGDSKNLEARASAYYWKNLFPKEINFYRDRFGEPPNNLLNYGYAILRAVIARGLVASGLLPTLGIHHKNKYNAYCLADDIMEPYRPFVDEIVLSIVKKYSDYSELNVELKKILLQIPAVDIYFGKEQSPLMVGLQRTTASLAKCFMGETKTIVYPELC
ncbi:MAG: type II CRISPR-associated endonuclease Cas1 [Ignavibacteria bacterium]|nr:type II CRISPR-associated endonuclease Cas1 [Ignavibacteria bacterium]